MNNKENNVIYNKYVFEEFENFIKNSFKNKKAIITVSNCGKKNIMTNIIYVLNKYNLSYKCFNTSQIKKIDENIRKNNTQLFDEKYDLIIGIGGGKTSDLTKYFANCFNAQSVFFPTIISNNGIFNNKYVIFENNYLKYKNSSFFTKIFIDKSVIEKLKYEKVIDCQKFLFSLVNSFDELSVFLNIHNKENSDMFIDYKNEIFSIFSEMNASNIEEEKNEIFFERAIKFYEKIKYVDFENCSNFNYSFSIVDDNKCCDKMLFSSVFLSSVFKCFFSNKLFLPEMIKFSSSNYDLLNRQILLSENSLFFKKINAIKYKYFKMFSDETNVYRVFLTCNYILPLFTCENSFKILSECLNKTTMGYLINIVNCFYSFNF